MLCAVQLLLGTFYALAVPALHGPDEHSHIDLINVLSADRPYPAVGELNLSNGTIAALGEVGLFPVSWRVAYEQPWTGLGRDDLLPRGARLTWEQLGGPGRSDIVNHVTGHPPLYYAGMASVSTFLQDVVGPAGASMPWDRQVGLLRLFNVLLLAPLPLLAFAATRRVGGSSAVATAAAAFPLAIPQLSHLAGTVNNDNLLTLLTGVLTVALAFVATGDLSVRTALYVGGLAGLGMLTKGFGLAAPAWIGLAYVVAAARAGAWRRPVRAAGVAAFATIAAGGWWELRLLARTGKVLQVEALDATRSDFVPDVPWWLWFFVRRMAHKFWGFFGIEQVSLPYALIVVATVLTLVALALAVRRRAWAGARMPQLDGAVLLAPTVTTLALVVLGAWQGYARTGLTTGVQGRYLFVGIVGIAVAVAAGASTVVAERWLPVGVIAGAAVLQVSGMASVTAGYWAGDGLPAQLRTVLFWSPWPPPVVVASWVALAVLGGSVLATAARGAGLPGSAGDPR